MKKMALAGLLAMAFLSTANAAEIIGLDTRKPGPYEVFVSLQPAHIKAYSTQDEKRSAVAESVKVIEAAYGVAAEKTYSVVLTGFLAFADEAAIHRLAGAPEVEYIEVFDGGGAWAGSYSTNDWALDRIHSVNPDMDARYENWEDTLTSLPRGSVHVYVLDSTMVSDASSIPGFAGTYWSWGWNFYRDNDKTWPHSGSGNSCDHGTTVVSRIASQAYGAVRNKAHITLHPVVVGNCTTPSQSATIDALEYIAAYHTKPAIINFSGAFGASATIDNAFRSVMDDYGVHVVAAAGNDNIDACEKSPGRGHKVFLVGATGFNFDQMKDYTTTFTNDGPCVELYAPGDDVKAIDRLGNTVTASGTSFSTPIVTAVMADLLYRAWNYYGYQYTPNGDTWYVLRDWAAQDVITGSPPPGEGDPWDPTPPCRQCEPPKENSVGPGSEVWSNLLIHRPYYGVPVRMNTHTTFFKGQSGQRHRLYVDFNAGNQLELNLYTSGAGTPTLRVYSDANYSNSVCYVSDGGSCYINKGTHGYGRYYVEVREATLGAFDWAKVYKYVN